MSGPTGRITAPEGHGLAPYGNLLDVLPLHHRKGRVKGGGTAEAAADNNDDDDDDDDDDSNNNDDVVNGGGGVEVRVHGGSIPRNHAARLNGACPDGIIEVARSSTRCQLAGGGTSPKWATPCAVRSSRGDGSDPRRLRRVEGAPACC